MPRKAPGFTLIEALAVLVVAAVLLAIAIPAWSHARAAARSQAVRATLAASMLGAVRHSALVGAEVVVCPVAASGQCNRSTNWDHGWIGFADTNANRMPDPGEMRLEGGNPLPADVHLRTTPGRTRLVFQPNGGSAGSNATFTLCDARGPASAMTLVLSNTGQFRAGRPTESAARNCVYGG